MTTPLPTLSPGAVKSVIVNSPGDAYTKASEAAGRSDLLLISCDGIRFPTHKAFLGTASTFFKSLLEIGEHASQPSEVKCAETGVELNEVLIFCYPVAAPFLGYHTREGLMKLARVADKLGMIRAVDSFCSALCRKLVLLCLYRSSRLYSPLLLQIMAHRTRHGAIRARGSIAEHDINALCPSLSRCRSHSLASFLETPRHPWFVEFCLSSKPLLLGGRSCSLSLCL